MAARFAIFRHGKKDRAMPVFTIPPSVPYSTGYVAFGDVGNCPPFDNPRSAPFYIDWSIVNANTPCVAMDYTSAPNMPSQIAGAYVDNSRSHQGVYILFPDTGFRLVIPPFKRGYYPVLTASKRFFAGIFAPAFGANDHTVIHILNWLPPTLEGDGLIFPVTGIVQFDPSAAQVSQPLISNPGGSWVRLREIDFEIGGLTAGAAGFQAYFSLLSDGGVQGRWALHLANNEFVDASTLFSLRNMNLAAINWTYSWTIVAGAATSDGATSGNLNAYADTAEPN
jgi:hypothetical protein